MQPTIQPAFTSEDHLLPCIVQDARNGRILMLGYMNREAFLKTCAESRVTFYSRSKKRLWTKGETSGNFLSVTAVATDCDQDTILISAMPAGPACHTGSATCFGDQQDAGFLYELERTIQHRRDNPQETSYTSRLLSSGINKVAQKVGEEAVELVIEAKDDHTGRFLDEAADLLYHYLILLAAKGQTLDDVVGVLESRSRKN